MNPETIGRYEILSEIGRGGMATIYQARDPNFGRIVAIKVLPAELMNESQFQARFQREAQMIATLEHPAIVPVYDFGEQDGQPYFVMRLMKGGSLADRIAEGPISIEETARIISRLAPALDHAHAKGIIHRDLKPGNILFDLEGNPYLSDFGIAKLSESSSTLTGSGIIGTPAYMSPEQTHGELDLDGRSDLYSLGVIIFEMLSGRVPYESDTPMGQIVMHTSTPIPLIFDINPNLPPETQTFMNRALAKRKFARFEKAADLVLAMNTLVDISSKSSANKPTEKNLLEPVERTYKITPPPRTPSTPLPANLTPPPPPTPPANRNVSSADPAAKQKRRPAIWLLAVFMLLILSGFTVYALFPDLLTAPGIGMVEQETAEPTAAKTVVPTEPALAAPLPTETETSTATPEPTLAQATSTPTLAPATPTPTLEPSGPIIGGADKIAFLKDNEIYIANLDATEIKQLTQTRSIKSGLQWMPDGEHVLFISGPCVQQVSIYEEKVTQAQSILCANWAQYLAAFEISPDHKWVALSLSDGLFIYPYDLNVLRQISRQTQLTSAEPCLALTNIRPRMVKWSNMSDQVAVVVISSSGGRQQEVIWVLDVSVCGVKELRPRIEFPGAHFTIDEYSTSPYISSFGWNGDYVFALNVDRKQTGFGFFYTFNMVTFADKVHYPLVKKCCFRDFNWSPDGTHLLFAFQDFDIQKETELYYINYLTLDNSGASYDPLPFPDGFFSNPKEKPMPVLRPVR